MMKYEDLKNFTWGELSRLTWEQLMMGKLELLEQVNQDATVPSEIADKLYQLCSDVYKSTGKVPVSLPANKKDLTVGIATKLLTFVVALGQSVFVQLATDIVIRLLEHYGLR